MLNKDLPEAACNELESQLAEGDATVLLELLEIVNRFDPQVLRNILPEDN